MIKVSCEQYGGDQSSAGAKSCIGFADSPFGLSLIGWQADSLLFLGFPSAPDEGLQQWQQQPRMPVAGRYDAQARQWSHRIFHGDTVSLRLMGTAFQLRVWQTLHSCSQPGHTLSYQQLATCLGCPSASRAVASALARNPLSWLIPCHRVIHSQHTHPGRYRWGIACKQAMQEAEKAGRLKPACIHIQGEA